MPYKDPEKAKAAKRASARKARVRRGASVDRLAADVKDAASLPDPPTRDVLLKALGVQAVEGNVPAIRLLLEEYRRDGDNDTEAKSKASVIDELAARRSA